MKQKTKPLLWIISLCGGLLPVVIDVTVWLIYEHQPVLKTLYNWTALYLKYGPLYFVFAVITTAVPFMILYAVANKLLTNKTPHIYAQRLSGVIIASIALLTFTIYINVTQSYHLYQASHGGSYEGSSTAGLTFLIFPILAIILEFLAYGIGWSIGKLITIFRCKER